ncbi:hypothetical protein NDU88_004602 [Pleurodeles waltl]|uniref:Uncharacterized protein n=1 Tax=Pleurodeles waltl TaxID=8319 RepID=A0AAV7M6R6_PLEWA|nr:hypothetical protein NDU88_004602 [Pleurodeles waltl]
MLPGGVAGSQPRPVWCCVEATCGRAQSRGLQYLPEPGAPECGQMELMWSRRSQTPTYRWLPTSALVSFIFCCWYAACGGGPDPQLFVVCLLDQAWRRP